MTDLQTAEAAVWPELAAKAELVSRKLAELLEEKRQIHRNLRDAIDYTLKAPGKRIRAALVLWCCELVCGKINVSAEVVAAAIEMVHTYSLVHDDLPAMDNDDLRRGLPTCHKVFGETTAILTGDALLTLAFEILAEKIPDARAAVTVIRQLAAAAGPEGMVAGQMADLLAENTEGNAELLEYIHTNKTARMFRCAAECGAICGQGSEDQVAALGQYGLKIGLAFQIADDILDVSSTSRTLGKTAGKDTKQGKVTYPSVLGLEKSRAAAEELAAQAVQALGIFGPQANLLRKLPAALLERTS
jgi:geranylgeranyl diphosphate synthase type II